MADIQSKSQSPDSGASTANSVGGGVSGAVATAVAPPAPPARRVGGGLLDPHMLWTSLPDAFKKQIGRAHV